MQIENKVQFLTRFPRLFWNWAFRAQYDFVFDYMGMSIRHMSLAKRINHVKAAIHFFHRKVRPWNWPLHMLIELTNYCNLKCPVCPTGSGEMSRQPTAMDASLFERLMEEVGPYLLTAQLYAWGESLLHPQLNDMLRIARSHNVGLLLSTNGQNLDDGVIETLMSHPPDYLIVSLDGLTDETNSKYRVGARLKPLLSGVRRLAQSKGKRGQMLPVLHMQFIVMKHNRHELPHLQEFARKNGFDQLTVRTLLTYTPSEEPHYELIPERDELRAYEYKDTKLVPREGFICQRPFRFPTVYADGTVVSCCQDYNAELPFGVLARGVSFSDLWFSKRAAEIRKVIRDTAERLSFCRNCPFSDRLPDRGCIQAVALSPEIGRFVPIHWIPNLSRPRDHTW